MIKYSLKCDHGHLFESWFRSSADYETLKSKALIECTTCGSQAVEKSLMAPRVNTGGNAEQVITSETLNPIQEMKKQLRSAKNVGWQFANEARAMHYGEKESVPIYGRTELEDAVELIKEGVGITPLPFDPDASEN